MSNTRDEAMTSAQMISNYGSNVKTYGIYNKTHRALDLLECGLGLCNRPTLPVFLIIKLCKEFIRENQNVSLFIVAHSQGAIHLKNALIFSPEIRPYISTLASAPGAIIPNSLCKLSKNYESKNDIVSLLQPLFVGPLFSHNDLKELTFLDPHPDAPLFDHAIASPTYQPEINKFINNIINDHGGPW